MWVPNFGRFELSRVDFYHGKVYSSYRRFEKSQLKQYWIEATPTETTVYLSYQDSKEAREFFEHFIVKIELTIPNLCNTRIRTVENDCRLLINGKIRYI